MTNVLEAHKPRAIKGYGWKKDLPDHRDRIFNLENTIKTDAQLPRTRDLEPHMPPVYDQGQLGSCTANGWAGIMEYMSIKEGGASDTPSRLFIYYCERVLENTVNEDSGAEVRTGAKVVSSIGAPPETDWIYNISQFAEKPPQQAYDDATKLEALTYKRVLTGPGAPVRTALNDGFPIVFGFSVPDYFEGGWDPSTPLPLAGPTTQIIGGHCVVAVGYDFSLQRFHVPAFKCRNSWGSSWGEAGYFWMDYRWLNNDADMWIVEKVS